MPTKVLVVPLVALFLPVMALSLVKTVVGLWEALMVRMVVSVVAQVSLVMLMGCFGGSSGD